MNNERFLQPLVEHLLLYIGFKQTLAYVSSRKEYYKERRWLIEHHAIVDWTNVDCFSDDIVIKYQLATIDKLEQLDSLPSSLTHLTFADSFNHPLDNETLPPLLTQLTFGWQFNQPLDNVTLPPTLKQLTFGCRYNQPLDGVTLPPTLTLLMFG